MSNYFIEKNYHILNVSYNRSCVKSMFINLRITNIIHLNDDCYYLELDTENYQYFLKLEKTLENVHPLKNYGYQFTSSLNNNKYLKCIIPNNIIFYMKKYMYNNCKIIIDDSFFCTEYLPRIFYVLYQIKCVNYISNIENIIDRQLIEVEM